MWKSKVLAKLKKNEPAICTKINIAHPWILEMAGMSGYDCAWLCMEHCTGDYVSIDNCIRAGKLHGMDAMVRVNKSGYSDIIKPLELDAAGIMYPHCLSPEEAQEAVRTSKFFPLGRRPIDGGNVDGDFGTVPLAEYVRQSNENKFLAIQIEDKEAIEHIEGIAATKGVDLIFVGPGDLSQSLGKPGETGCPEITATIERVAKACQKHGTAWGLPTSKDNIRTYYDMGARFLVVPGETPALTHYFKSYIEDVLKLLP